MYVRVDHRLRDVTLSHAGDFKLLKGNVLKIEGEIYTVHDTACHEIRLHVDKTTHLAGGAFRVEDKTKPT